MADNTPAILITLYKAMYDLTVPECRYSCLAPMTCCTPAACEFTERFAKEERGVILERTDNPKLPFMSKDGCTVAPHLRPHCTVHTCDINTLGYKKDDDDWSRRYFNLRADIEKEELRLKGMIVDS